MIGRAAGGRLLGKQATAPVERRRRRSVWRHLPYRTIAVLIAVALLVGAVWRAFLEDWPTSFTARVHTTAVRFTTATSEEGDDGTGLFAPSKGALAIAVRGCIALDPLSEQARAPVPCREHGLQMENVRLSSFVLDPQTVVTLTTFDSGVRVQLRPPAHRSTFHCVVSAGPQSRVFDSAMEIRGKEGAPLAAGQWLLRPVENDLVLSMVEGRGAEALPDEADTSLSEGSDVWFEQRGVSALVGTENTLNLPLADEQKAALGDGRLQLTRVQKGSIRSLHWVRSTSAPTSMSLVVSGRSKAIQVFGEYADESTNYAITWFDGFSKGRHTRSLIAAATTLAVIATVLSGAATCGVWWIERQRWCHEKQKPEWVQDQVRSRKEPT